MSVARRPLSKSNLVAARQCAKKHYLERHRRGLARYSKMSEAGFRAGHAVGEVAKRIFGTPGSVEIPYDPDLSKCVRQTRELLDNGAKVPLFEASFEYRGIVVRVDVLLPVANGWRAIEVKSSTEIKDVFALDCGIQLYVMRGAGLPVTGISLAHIDRRFVYQGNGDYRGLLVEHDFSQVAHDLVDDVESLVETATAAIAGDMPEPGVGTWCSKPYDCQFMHICWPYDAEYPVMGLGGSKAKLAEWVNGGARDIRDVDAEQLTSETDRRIHAATQNAQPELKPGAKDVIEGLDYPRYYLDFETVGPAVPTWEGTRSYDAMPVQWSCHIDDGSGGGRAAGMRHAEFLDLSGEPPMRPLAEALILCLGESGPVLTYSTYEKQVIDKLIDRYPDLSAPLQAIEARLFDLLPLTREHFYHPRMLGSWSIKSVIPAIAPDLDYSTIEGINEGTAAAEGYLEAIDPQTSPVRRRQLETQLRRYCRLDTEAMVELVRFLGQ